MGGRGGDPRVEGRQGWGCKPQKPGRGLEWLLSRPIAALLMQDPGALPFPFPDESLSRGHIPVNRCCEWGHHRLQEPVG